MPAYGSGCGNRKSSHALQEWWSSATSNSSRDCAWAIVSKQHKQITSAVSSVLIQRIKPALAIHLPLSQLGDEVCPEVVRSAVKVTIGKYFGDCMFRIALF